MKLNTLKVFIKLCDIGSYSKVAEEMDLTQPAVSMQIKSLEEFFNTELIDRKGGKLKQTQAGEILYRHSRAIIKNWQQAELQISQITEEIAGSIKIGASTIPSVYFLPPKLAQFRQDFPNIQVEVLTGDSQDMIERLERGEADLIIIGKKLSSDRFNSEPLREDSLKLIVDKDHPLIDVNKVTISDLIQYPFVFREEGSGTRKVMLEAFKEQGYSQRDLKIGYKFGSTEAVISAVEAGLGISFVSQLAAAKAADAGRIEIIESKQLNLNRYLYLIYEKGRRNETMINQLYKHLTS
ncbi:MAG: selenium metabolism-associated LysR family transcriptional regulator [Bacillota bacterium]